MRLAKARRMPQLEQLATRLDCLADFEACPFPVISLYLNLQADEHGKDRFEPFLRKELADQIHQRQSGSLQGGGTRAAGQRGRESAEGDGRAGRSAGAVDGETGETAAEKEKQPPSALSTQSKRRSADSASSAVAFEGYRFVARCFTVVPVVPTTPRVIS